MLKFHSRFRAIVGVAAIVTLVSVLAACAAAPAMPATDVPPAATEVATSSAPSAPEDAQPDSPLAQPDSPLAQPETPLELPEVGIGKVLKDFNLITRIASEQKAGAPEAGKAAISGLLYTYSTNEVIPGTPFYLIPGIKDGDRYLAPTMYVGPREENGDVAGTTDGYGRFSFRDVKPGVYYLAVFAPYDWLLAFPSKEATSPLQITLEEGEELNLGLLWLGWP